MKKAGLLLLSALVLSLVGCSGGDGAEADVSAAPVTDAPAPTVPDNKAGEKPQVTAAEPGLNPNAGAVPETGSALGNK
jgi:hypothetical protein